MSQTLRHRELVLSLKYSTIEACFSVPMLNLTMPNLPFLLAYATSALRWHSWAIGVMAALSHICNCLQPAFSRFLQRRWSLHTIMRGGFIISGIPWFCIGLSSFLPGMAAHAAFAVLLTIATMANSVTSVAWSAAISEVVPVRISGTYFGRRNLIFGAWTLIAVLTAGKIVDLAGGATVAFASIFAASGLARLLGLFFLQKMKFPAVVTAVRPINSKLSETFKPLLDRNYRNYMFFVGFWGLFLNMGLPFYTVYLIRYLHINVGGTIVLSTLSTLGGIMTLRSWGALADLLGSKPVQYVCSYIWIFVGLVGWAVVGPNFHIHLFLVFGLLGAATAGFQLAQFNLMLRLIPTGMGSLYIPIFLAVTSALTAAGPVLGGALLAWVPRHLGTILGHEVMSYHLLFVLSFLGCLLSLPLLTSAQEPASQEVHKVWRSMWRMRSFNPLIALSSGDGFLLTPRGMLSFGRHSVRSLRRQFKRVVNVGADLIEGGQSLIK